MSDEQIAECPAGGAGFIYLCFFAWSMGRQHCARNGVSSPTSASTPSVRDPADQLAEKLDVAPEPRVRCVRRADEQVRNAGPLDGEHLGVKIREEGPVSLSVKIIFGQACRWVEFVDLQTFEAMSGGSAPSSSPRETSTALSPALGLKDLSKRTLP